MPAITLQAGLPWSASYEEDRRFLWILSMTLAVSLVIGAITPYIRIPQADSGIEKEPPPRRVRLLAEQPIPAGRPGPPVAKPVVTAPPASPTTAVEAAPSVTPPRHKAQRSGVLAMRDALTELQASAPYIATSRESVTTDAQTDSAPTQPSVLATNVASGSGGIEGGVTHQSVLGATGLPERKQTGQGSDIERNGVANPRSAPSPTDRVRSQEEIQELLDRNKGAMYTLYNRELRKDASLQGKLVVSITIAPAGNVTRCDILSSELGSASLEQQLVALVSSIDFGNKPGVAVVTTKIPIEFFPR